MPIVWHIGPPAATDPPTAAGTERDTSSSGWTKSGRVASISGGLALPRRWTSSITPLEEAQSWHGAHGAPDQTPRMRRHVRTTPASSSASNNRPGPSPSTGAGRLLPATTLDEPARRDPRAARGRGAVPGRPGRRGRSDRRLVARPPDRSTSSSPRAGRRTMPRSTPSTCSASGIGCRSGSGRRRSCRSTAPRRTVADALVIGISQSGASPDIVAVVAAARAQGARPSPSPTTRPRRWPRPPDRTIALGAGPERAIAATKTYTAELLAIALLSAALADDPADRAARRGHPGRPRRRRSTLEPEIERIAADQAAATRALVIARGYEYATAREWALKLKELAHVFADPYSSADFQHGPLALVEPGVPVIAVARAGAPEADLDRAPRPVSGTTSAPSSSSPRTSRPRSSSRPGRSPCPRAPRNGSGRSSRSSPASSTPTT